jgi:hypothetical protein
MRRFALAAPADLAVAVSGAAIVGAFENSCQAIAPSSAGTRHRKRFHRDRFLRQGGSAKIMRSDHVGKGVGYANASGLDGESSRPRPGRDP